VGSFGSACVLFISLLTACVDTASKQRLNEGYHALDARVRPKRSISKAEPMSCERSILMNPRRPRAATSMPPVLRMSKV
jgi:hypothetical protein